MNLSLLLLLSCIKAVVSLERTIHRLSTFDRKIDLRNLLNYVRNVRHQDIYTTALNKRQNSLIKTQKRCIPRQLLISTYTHDRGIQSPNMVLINRCQGGIKNPENYQCQPKRIVIECFRTVNHNKQDDFIGTYTHQSCEERCVCNRKTCAGKKIYALKCPKGFMESKQTCQCVSLQGESIFYRNMGIIEDWDANLHRICRNHAQRHTTSPGKSFKVNIAL